MYPLLDSQASFLGLQYTNCNVQLCNSWGVLFNYYNTQVYPGDNMVALSWIGSLWFCLCGITNPFYQWMSSKFNDRYLILIACIFSGLSLILASITNEVGFIYDGYYLSTHT